MSSYRATSDHDLIASLRKDDRKAFEEIYRRYAALLFHYVADKIYTKEDCEEIVQETFVWLWTRRTSLGHVTELRPYLYGIVKHKIFNYIRHNVIRREYATHFLKFHSPVDNSNEELVNLADVLRILDETIANLPERCQTAFKLSRIEHQPIGNIATQMNISTRTVENYITQALRQLREACTDFYRQRKEP